jgi:hypothetical protein
MYRLEQAAFYYKLGGDYDVSMNSWQVSFSVLLSVVGISGKPFYYVKPSLSVNGIDMSRIGAT